MKIPEFDKDRMLVFNGRATSTIIAPRSWGEEEILDHMMALDFLVYDSTTNEINERDRFSGLPPPELREYITSHIYGGFKAFDWAGPDRQGLIFTVGLDPMLTTIATMVGRTKNWEIFLMEQPDVNPIRPDWTGHGPFTQDLCLVYMREELGLPAEPPG